MSEPNNVRIKGTLYEISLAVALFTPELRQRTTVELPSGEEISGAELFERFERARREAGASEVIDLGHGVWIATIHCNCESEHDHTHPCGLTWSHRRPDGLLCEGGGFIPLNTTHGWKVESWEPLTLSPSLLCMRKECGTHGFIREGKWVPA